LSWRLVCGSGVYALTKWRVWERIVTMNHRRSMEIQGRD
jgi:hypothetical protein